MGKQKKLIGDELDRKETMVLETDVKTEVNKWKNFTENKYVDDYEPCGMMKPEYVKEKNLILRKTKLMELKANRMPDFLRIKKE